MKNEKIPASPSQGGRKKSVQELQPNYQKTFKIFMILAVFLISTIIYFSLSQSTIEVTPTYHNQQIGFAVQVIDKKYVVPGRILTEKIVGDILEIAVEDSQTFSVEPYEEPESKASGEVTIINNYSRNQALIATTRLLTPGGKLYRLTETVTVPAGAKITAYAIADEEGSEFETGSVKMTIPGLWEPLQDKIYAETSGGFKIQTITRYKIDQNIIDAARNELKQNLINQAKEEFKYLEPGSSEISDKALVAETIKYSTDAEIGSDQKEFSITLGLGVKAVIFDEEKLKEVALNNLPNIYKTSNTQVSIDTNSFVYEIIILDENSESLIAQIKGEYSIMVSNIQLDASMVAGMSKKEAQTYLENLNDVKEVSINLPFWSRSLPATSDKISIEIKK